jgi:hypothetical protein
MDNGDYDQAIGFFTEAVRLDPNDASAYCHCGFAYSRKGDYDRAIKDITEAIRLDPNNASAYFFRGDAYRNKGDDDRAIKDISEAARLDPNYTTLVATLVEAKAAVQKAAEQKEKEAFRQSYNKATGKDISLSDVVRDNGKWAYDEDVKAAKARAEVEAKARAEAEAKARAEAEQKEKEEFRQRYNETTGKDISLSDVVKDREGKWAYEGDIKAAAEAKAAAEIEQAKGDRRKRIVTIIVLAAVVVVAIPIIRGFTEQAALKKAIADQSAWPADGTYTFEPRPRARQGSGSINQWLVKIVVRSGNVDLYLTSKSTGKGAKSALSFGPPSTLVLAQTGNGNYKAVKAPVWDEKTGAYIVSFQNVTSTHFWYCETKPNPDVYIAGITLVNPDE